MQTRKWLVGLALFALLALLCVTRHAPRIEAEQTARGREALAGVPGLRVIEED
jgi:hypothetical protein